MQRQILTLKHIFYIVTIAITFTAFLSVSAVGSASAAGSSQAVVNSSHVTDTAAVTVQISRLSPAPTCFRCCPSGDLQYQYTFTWIAGLIRENITGSYHFPGHCTGSVTLNWENCYRDTQNATVTQCLNYPGASGRRWVEADINVTAIPYVNHTTWGAFSVDPYGNNLYQQGPNP